ncbi:hypothetical protein KKI24_01320 [bacterium]|nr:hypothetical protein [bacterium]
MEKTRPKKSLSPRESAALDLLAWHLNGKIDYRHRSDLNSPQNYALYRNLVSSVIRYRDIYYFFIRTLTGRSIEKLDPEVVVCLMLGLAQMDELSGIHDHAAVNETVNLISFLRKPHLKGFINGNLRSFLRKKADLNIQLAKQPLSVQSSHPDWMVNSWVSQYGQAVTEETCIANNRQPKVRIVLNPAFDREKIEADLESRYEIIERHAEGFTVANPAGLFDTRWVDEGAFLVQDSSSQQINHLIEPLPKTCVLDACAAPGGKLFHMEWRFGIQIKQLVAIELSEQRLLRLKANQKRYRSRSILVRMDATCPALKSCFDLIVIDAPCSATGTIQKHPEVKWQRTRNDVLQNQQKQLSILTAMKNVVKENGYILYVTCSLEKEENQDVIQKFLENESRTFRQVPFSPAQADERMLTRDGFYQCLPGEFTMGLFAALLQKKDMNERLASPSEST